MEAYLGEVRMFAGPFAPEGWMICAGQEMDVSQNQALYSLLGDVYGGVKYKTFRLPDLRNRFPMQLEHMELVGKLGGTTEYKIAPENLPAHEHTVVDPGHSHGVNIPAHTHSFAVPIANPGDGLGSIVGGYADAIQPASYSAASTPGSTLGPGVTGLPIAPAGTPATGTSGTTATAMTGIVVNGGNPKPLVPLTIMPPSLSINFIICVTGGEYPTRPN